MRKNPYFMRGHRVGSKRKLYYVRKGRRRLRRLARKKW